MYFIWCKQNIKTNFILLVGLLAFTFFSCSEDNGDPNDTSSSNLRIGPIISFIKQDDANPEDQTNQDRLTSKVWITRGNNGGQIYNVAIESSSDKSESPLGTECSIGEIGEIDSLIFSDFRSAVGKLQNIIVKSLVLNLVEEDIYLSVKFTSWSQVKKGGFTYEEVRLKIFHFQT